jgi:hypothetical protein
MRVGIIKARDSFIRSRLSEPSSIRYLRPTITVEPGDTYHGMKMLCWTMTVLGLGALQTPSWCGDWSALLSCKLSSRITRFASLFQVSGSACYLYHLESHAQGRFSRITPFPRIQFVRLPMMPTCGCLWWPVYTRTYWRSHPKRRRGEEATAREKLKNAWAVIDVRLCNLIWPVAGRSDPIWSRRRFMTWPGGSSCRPVTIFTSVRFQWQDDKIRVL